MADLAATVFHEFVSLSIQHLVNEIGERMFERYPALTEITFEAQNRTFDTAEESEATTPQGLHRPAAAVRPDRPDDAS